MSLNLCVCLTFPFADDTEGSVLFARCECTLISNSKECMSHLRHRISNYSEVQIRDLRLTINGNSSTLSKYGFLKA